MKSSIWKTTSSLLKSWGKRVWDRTMYRGPIWNHLAKHIPPVPEGVHGVGQGHDQLVSDLDSVGLSLGSLEIDAEDFERYLETAEYDLYPWYYRNDDTLVQKALEHYVSFKLLEINEGDTLIDIASRHSPATDIARRLYGCKAYKLDLVYEPGIHGEFIGADASRMPLPDGFASKMTLHSSFEHFEDESDIDFIREAGRVLRDGGQACIIPFNIGLEYFIQTDPTMFLMHRPNFDPDAKLYHIKRYHTCHSRIYDALRFKSRLVDNLGPLKIELFRVENAKSIYPLSYLDFVAILTRTGDS